jgi:hypothetical protein
MMAMVSILNPREVHTLLNVNTFLVVVWSLKK